MALRRDRILVRLDGVRGVNERRFRLLISCFRGFGGGRRLLGGDKFWQDGGVVGVDGRHNGKVVLVFVEVGGGGGVGIVEGVVQTGEEGAEGELRDLVGEVERYMPQSVLQSPTTLRFLSSRRWWDQ